MMGVMALLTYFGVKNSLDLDLALHHLSLSHKKDPRLIWVNWKGLEGLIHSLKD